MIKKKYISQTIVRDFPNISAGYNIVVDIASLQHTKNKTLHLFYRPILKTVIRELYLVARRVRLLG